MFDMTYEEEFVHECAYYKKKFSSYSAGAGWLYKNKQNWKRKWFCGFECYQKGYRGPLEQKARAAARIYGKVK